MDYNDKFIFHSSDLPTKSFMFFAAKREEFCDITLKVGERSIAAHRMILSAAIPYFYDIFREKQDLKSREREVNFPDVDPDALKSIIDFAYTCQIEVNDDNVNHLLSAACLLHVDQVKNECLSFLVSRLKSENALSTREVLCKVCSSEELEKVNSYIRDNFEEVSRTSDILNIPFDALKDFIEDDNLKIESEESVYETVIKWVKQYPDERKQYLPHLLSNVRLSFINPSYIRNHILKEELVRTSIECRDLMDEVLCHHIAPEERVEVRNFVSKPRNLPANDREDVDGISSIYVVHFKIRNMVQRLNTDDAGWNTVHNSDWLAEYIKLTACELNKSVYIFFPKFTYVYDLQQNVFSFCKGMTLPMRSAASVQHNNKLYVIGGIVSDTESFEVTNTVQCFDPKSQEWIVLTGMNTSCCAAGTVASRKFIFCLGGMNSSEEALNSVESYNVKTGLWTAMPPMLLKRVLPGCAMLNEKIYVCCGMTADSKGTSIAEMFDPVVNEWKFISSLKRATMMCKLVPYRGKLYGIGCEDLDIIRHVVEIYEPNTNEWECGPPLEEGPLVVCAAVVNMPSK